MNTDLFDFHLPAELIAQTPAPHRDASRLLVVPRGSGPVQHAAFPDFLAFLRPGDVLVMNDSRVFPARLRGFKPATKGLIELLLLEETSPHHWWSMVRPGKRLRPGTEICIPHPQKTSPPLRAVIRGKNQEGHCLVEFMGSDNLMEALNTMGEIPLPPYIVRSPDAPHAEDKLRYQTVYAQTLGSVAAPTAGLHFTTDLLEKMRSCGIELHWVTLHVGPGTFAPVKATTLDQHVMHEERFSINGPTAQALTRARQEQRRIIAVGTTTVRVLETVAAQNDGNIVPTQGRTRIFIHPPYTFQAVHGLLTNFHLPKSTLLMLVSAFAAPGPAAGRERLLAAYAEAVQNRYRFFSYGDAMLLL